MHETYRTLREALHCTLALYIISTPLMFYILMIGSILVRGLMAPSNAWALGSGTASYGKS